MPATILSSLLACGPDLGPPNELTLLDTAALVPQATVPQTVPASTSDPTTAPPTTTPPAPGIPAIGAPAVDFVIDTIEGPFRLSDHAGDVILLDLSGFW
jgi:hypothetical protein